MAGGAGGFVCILDDGCHRPENLLFATGHGGGGVFEDGWRVEEARATVGDGHSTDGGVGAVTQGSLHHRRHLQGRGGEWTRSTGVGRSISGRMEGTEVDDK